MDDDYDPVLDVAIEAMHGIVAQMGDDERAAFCLLSDEARARVILRALLDLRDHIMMVLMYGENYDGRATGYRHAETG